MDWVLIILSVIAFLLLLILICLIKIFSEVRNVWWELHNTMSNNDVLSDLDDEEDGE